VKPIPDGVHEEFVQSSYVIAIKYLKQSMSYIWLKANEGMISSTPLELSQGRLLTVILSIIDSKESCMTPSCGKVQPGRLV